MKLFLLTLIIFLASCKTTDTAVADSSNKPEALGWYHGSCVASQKELTPQDDIILVGKAQQVIKVSVVGYGSAETCAALMEGRAAVNRAEDNHFYEVISKEQSISAEELGVVVMQSSLGKQKQLDINSNELKDVVDYCTTSEGVRFYMWDEEKGREHPFWQSYYYLGYDVEADCEF